MLPLFLLPLLAVGGCVLPPLLMPRWLARLGAWTPFGALRNAYHDLLQSSALERAPWLALFALVLALGATRALERASVRAEEAAT